MISPTLTKDGDIYRLEGTVTIADATRLYGEMQAQFRDAGLPGSVTLDCSAVAVADSATIALLLEAHRVLEAVGKSLRVTGLREQLVNLVKIYGVEWILEPDAT